MSISQHHRCEYNTGREPERISLPSWTAHPLYNTREVFQSLSRMGWEERGLAVMVSRASWQCCRVRTGHTMMMGGGSFGLQSISRELAEAAWLLQCPLPAVLIN